jgi:hypothetical protein
MYYYYHMNVLLRSIMIYQHLINVVLHIINVLQDFINFLLISYKFSVSRLSGVVVSVLATGPKGCRFKTRPRRWIFKGDKNPQHTFLSDGK